MTDKMLIVWTHHGASVTLNLTNNLLHQFHQLTVGKFYFTATAGLMSDRLVVARVVAVYSQR